MSEPAKKIADVSVNEVHIAPGRRDDPKRVEELATSMRVSGLLQPIGVTPQKKLIFGLHRLMAARQLGWATIPTVTLDLDELHTELAEIDENLERRQLPALELGEVLLRRKEIYEQLHPTTRHGGDRKSDQSKSSEDDLHLISFADGAARRLGVQPATVRQYIRVARRVLRSCAGNCGRWPSVRGSPNWRSSPSWRKTISGVSSKSSSTAPNRWMPRSRPSTRAAPRRTRSCSGSDPQDVARIRRSRWKPLSTRAIRLPPSRRRCAGRWPR